MKKNNELKIEGTVDTNNQQRTFLNKEHLKSGLNTKYIAKR